MSAALGTGYQKLSGFCWEQTTGPADTPVGQPPICNGRKATFQLQVSENKDRIASLPKLNPGAARTWPQAERWLQRCGREVGAGRAVEGRWLEEAASAFLAGVNPLQRF